jgi:nitrite reductase/ring-hydroxylating ferredoxin subunit
VAVFQAGETWLALSDRCPHAGGSLGQGWIDDGEVVCPLHQWRFRLKDGTCSTMVGHGVHRFPVEIRQDRIWVLV